MYLPKDDEVVFSGNLKHIFNIQQKKREKQSVFEIGDC